jgi:hypothetical protein
MQRLISPSCSPLVAAPAFQTISTTLPAVSPAVACRPQDMEMSLPPQGLYPSREALFEAIQAWAQPRGYAFVSGKSKHTPGSNRMKVWFSCDRCYKAQGHLSNSRTATRGTGCEFSVIGIETVDKQEWELKHRPESKYSAHNHGPSDNPAAHPSFRHMPPITRNLNSILHSAGK